MKDRGRLAHVEHIPIRWGDMDAMGHVNNTTYFRYMEQARIGWFDALVPGEAARREISIVIANASCTYRRPLVYPGVVEVKVYVGAPGGSSLPTFYELHLVGDRHLYADGEATVVFVDPAKQKPLRVPEALRSRLTGAPA